MAPIFSSLCFIFFFRSFYLITSSSATDLSSETQRQQIFLENSYLLPSSSSSLSSSYSNNEVCIFTISAWNNYGFVQAFFDAVTLSNPAITCRVWVVADTPTFPDIIAPTVNPKKFQIITVTELMTVSPFSIDDLAFKFDLVEFSTTIKPLAFLYLFKIVHAKHVLYFDNDVWVTHSLSDLINKLSTKLTVVTPHVSVPIPEDGKHQRDINILKAGVLNFGFVSFTNHPKTLEFISWWYERLRFYGYVALERGMHFDQNWGHFIFVFFNSDEFYILRDPRYNIAYWNLHYTGAMLHYHQEEKRPYLNDLPVVFMHLSGVSLFEEYDLNTISRHQNRYTLQNFPLLEKILTSYIQHVTSFEVEKYRKIPYGYNYFSDKSAIPNIVKQYYVQISDSVDVFEPNRFQIRSEAKDYFQSLHFDDPFLVSDWLPLPSSPYSSHTSSSSSSSSSSITHIIGQNDHPKTFAEFLLSGPYNFITDCNGAYYFSELEHIIYRQRSDLQHVFPDPFGTNYWDFKHWFSSSVPSEYNIRGGLLDMWRRKVNKASRIAKLGPTREKVFGVTVIGWHNGMFGVGISAAMMFNNLLVAGADVNAMSLYGASVHKHIKGRIPEEYLTRSPTKPINIFVANADNTQFLHEVYPEPLWKRHYNIGVWAWELDIFPSDWMPYLNHFDEIWVPSTFVQRSILSSPLYSKYPTPVHVFPFGYSKQKALEAESSTVSKDIDQIIPNTIRIPAKTFVFFMVFDYYSVMERKNPLAVIKAFQDAFPRSSSVSVSVSSPEVMLIIKTSKPVKLFQTDRQRLLTSLQNDDRIHLIERIISDEEMKLLFQRMDCYVSLHRSEGYGINILEAMLAGVPTIATDYGGNADFFAADKLIRQVHYPIPYDLIAVDSSNTDYNPYKISPGAHWAQPKHENAVLAMKTVVSASSSSSSSSSVSSSSSSSSLMRSATEKLRRLFGDQEVGMNMINRLQSTHWMTKIGIDPSADSQRNSQSPFLNGNGGNGNGGDGGGSGSGSGVDYPWKTRPNAGNRAEKAARLHKRVIGTVRYAPPAQ
jgi:glycosyltransferase involved in cell wall biosynthesis